MTRAGPDAARRPNPWAVELLDVISLRRWVLAGVAVCVGVAGSVVAVLLPDVLPPRPIAGAAVGVASYLLGLAAAIGVDAADPVIRGRRHVETTGAVVAANITGLAPNPELVSWVERLIRDHKGLRIAVSTTGTEAPGSGQLSDDLGVALARRGLHVLIINLEKSDEEWPGASEVCGGEVTLSDVVEFHPSLQLARLGPGRDRSRALSEFTMLASSLPLDVDVLVVALPGLGCVGTLPALAAVDRALLLAATDVTSRVELLAALESVDEIRMPTDVVLVRGLTVVAPGPAAADPIDLWSGAMATASETEEWRGEMVTIVAPPRQEGADTMRPTETRVEGTTDGAGGSGKPQSQAVPSLGVSMNETRAHSHEPSSSTMPAAGRFSDPHAYKAEQRQPRTSPPPVEARFDDSETELRLAAWVDTLGEDEGPDEAGGR
ncbi:MAG: hypothetical protein ABR592_13365 [Nitriliruptorales bacterium]